MQNVALKFKFWDMQMRLNSDVKESYQECDPKKKIKKKENTVPSYVQLYYGHVSHVCIYRYMWMFNFGIYCLFFISFFSSNGIFWDGATISGWKIEPFLSCQHLGNKCISIQWYMYLSTKGGKSQIVKTEIYETWVRAEGLTNKS